MLYMDNNNTIKIVHLSDLHFDAKKKQYDKVWNSLVIYLSTKLKPDLVLITGDIVDTPNRENFEKASKELKHLNQLLGGNINIPKYLVCAGNHDRHIHGNALPWRRESELFEQFFPSPWTPRCGAPYTKWLGKNPYQWKVNIMGVDSSRKSKYSAQGFMDEDDFRSIRQIKERENEGSPPCLTILLMHHHLLPLPATEPSEQSGPGVVKWLTSSANPGTILENLASSYIDLVLHGHEHKKNLALYGSYKKDSGQVAVVSSGSATGMDTKKGQDLKRATFNVLELKSDKSVWIKEINGPGNNSELDWEVAAGSEKLLINKTTLRHHRFLRSRYLWRKKHQAPEQSLSTIPFSQYQKHITITKTRDAIVDEMRTHWSINGTEFTSRLKNVTGVPCDGKVIISSTGSESIELPTSIFPDHNDSNARILRATLPNQNMRPDSIKSSYTWLDAIILTQDDFALVDMKQAGPFRYDKLEFVAATVTQPLASLTLTLNFPIGFCPKEDSVWVYQENLQKKSTPEKDCELQQRIIHTGQAILLSIPYPLNNHSYMIVWSPVKEISSTTDTIGDKFKYLIESNDVADQLTKTFLTGFIEQTWKQLPITIVLYIPETKSGNHLLRQVAFNRSETQDEYMEKAPMVVDMRKLRGIYLRAWRNELAIAVRGTNTLSDEEARQDGMLNREQFTAVIPINGLVENDSAPWAIVRIGIGIEHSPSHDNLIDLEKLREALARGRIILLNELSNLE
mgnify:CR=1 FL=1